MKKRILSALLALCMVFALGTVGAMATDEPETPTTPTEPEAKHTIVYVNAEWPAVDNGTADQTGKVFYRNLGDAIKASNESDSKIETIVLESNISPDVSYVTATQGAATYYITRSITIDGNNKVATVKNGTSTEQKNVCVFTVDGSDVEVTIKNLTINGSNISKHGINVFGGATVTLNNVTSSGNYGYGVCINGSSVTATELTAQNNAWGGVNVDSNGTKSSFTMNSGNLTNNGGNEKASVVIESDEGDTTSTTLKSGTFDRVYTHDKDSSNPADGDDEITITGGTFIRPAATR